jgi:hypothetical protein
MYFEGQILQGTWASSAEEFLKLHLREMEYIDWEPELMGGVGE